MWAAARSNSLALLGELVGDAEAEVDVNARDDFGATPLMHAASRGHADAVALLLDARADPSVQDVESGYSALHCALLGCHLASATVLIRAGCSVHAPLDHEGLTPLELLAARWGSGDDAEAAAGWRVGAGEAYTWGESACVALGRAPPSGATSRTTGVGRVESSGRVARIAAAKHHTLMVDTNGALLACGLGVGGRLGTGDEGALAAPTFVPLPSGRRALAVAAGLDHSLLVTECGRVYSWGNRTAPLGYDLGADGGLSEHQLTPRRVRFAAPPGEAAPHIVHVAASARHSLCVTRGGALYTWGSNAKGQLGLSDEVVAADGVAVTPRRVDRCVRGTRNFRPPFSSACIH